MKNKNNGDYSILISDFGPITSGSINISPLTIFVGPNECGKSFASMLLYSYKRSLEQISPINPLTDTDYRENILNLFSKNQDLQEFLKKQEVNKEFLVSNETIREISCYFLKLLVNVVWPIYLRKTFSSGLWNLIRARKPSSSIDIKSNYYSFGIKFDKYKNKLELNDSVEIKFSIKLKFLDAKDSNNEKEPIKIKENDKSIVIELRQITSNYTKEQFSYFRKRIIDAIIESCYSLLAYDKINEYVYIDYNRQKNYYFPASRTGIFEVHRDLASVIVDQRSLFKTDQQISSDYLGIIDDFISPLLSFKNIKGKYYRFSRNCESKLFNGKIVVQFDKKYSSPNMFYLLKKSRKKIPIHLTSSGVTELAPFFIYLQYIIQENSLLIIEEPESHLHPENQRLFAQLIAKLIRQGLHILITTHSDFFLEQINNFVLLKDLSPEIRRKLGYDGNDYLNPDEVSIHRYVLDEIKRGYKIENVEYIKERGFSQKEFLESINKLYHETTEILDLISSNDK